MIGVDLDRVRICLRELASREFQERTWLARSGPEVSSFSEQVSQLFDDTGLSDAIEAGTLEKVVGAESVLAFKALDVAISGVDRSLPPDELILHPSMQRVRESALRALQSLERNDG